MNIVVVKKDFLATIKNEKRFIDSVQLGRILGALRYNKIIQAKISEEKETNSSLGLYLFLNQAALLSEGIRKFDASKSSFDKLPFYKKHSAKINEILREAKDPNSFTNTVLKKVRDKIAFHFDEIVIKEIIEDFVDDCIKEKREIVLISGKSKSINDMTYIFADNMNINYVLRSMKEEGKSDEDKFKILCERILSLSEQFCKILEELIPDLVSKYCEYKES